jgi:DNA-binding ferritin-like protein (Dps family)
MSINNPHVQNKEYKEVKMRIQDIIQGKKEWRAHVARMKSLPKDYQIVYNEIEKYLFKVGPVELEGGIGLLSGIIDLFEEGVAFGKGVLEVTGSNVAAFCDDLIKDSKTYADIYQESSDQEVNKAMKKVTDKIK